ncbi:MAG: YbaB/EbfC family nucleoid-associated protein [Planctomycetota bacterium]|nr:MAG: YbaB/EbfC family nucleoid-associated protein [Planctomycetota bacterium]
MSGPLGDMGSLLRQAQQMQRELDKVREELKKTTVRGSAGGGAVQIEASGDRKITRVKIDPELVRGGDAALIEELVLLASKDALTKAEQLAEKGMSRITGGLQLPGM